MSQNPLHLEGCQIAAFRPKKGRKSADGDELEPPKIVLVLEIDVDRLQQHMTRITKAWSNERPIDVVLDWVEQLELPKLEPASDNDKRARVTDPLGAIHGNGHSAGAAKEFGDARKTTFSERRTGKKRATATA